MAYDVDRRQLSDPRPPREFEVALGPSSRLVLSFAGLGPPLDRVREVQPLERDSYAPGACELIPARLASLENDLRELKQSGNFIEQPGIGVTGS